MFLFDFRTHTASTFTGRAFLAVKKDTAKSRTASGKPAKELAFANPPDFSLSSVLTTFRKFFVHFFR